MSKHTTYKISVWCVWCLFLFVSSYDLIMMSCLGHCAARAKNIPTADLKKLPALEEPFESRALQN